MRSKRGDRAYFLDSVVQLVRRSRIGHGRRSRRRHHESPGVARICSPARLLGSLKLIGPPRYTDARWRAPFGRQNQGSLHGGEHKNESTAFPESLKGNSRPPAVLNHSRTLPQGDGTTIRFTLNELPQEPYPEQVWNKKVDAVCSFVVGIAALHRQPPTCCESHHQPLRKILAALTMRDMGPSQRAPAPLARLRRAHRRGLPSTVTQCSRPAAWPVATLD